ncbi:hypothetical protein [Pajaroellobacter abortibovis]|uniref:Uncharacterized protein n=1 Tax=Pajaroellobacter abortibovis TaxID=1882918 RepID=A0A1L6MV44_9BACT|nr:hypothetical protein [Pajaroellobacter abortibovis]APR99388.1 hypothetical protein BCY86_00855 [Pajaroellobacter abortibovis]
MEERLAKLLEDAEALASVLEQKWIGWASMPGYPQPSCYLHAKGGEVAGHQGIWSCKPILVLGHEWLYVGCPSTSGADVGRSSSGPLLELGERMVFLRNNELFIP